MLKEACRKGMKVYFGRTNGEKTLGEVIKVNPTKAKVKTLEDRGNGRGCEPGSVWSVPFSMMTPADGEKVELPPQRRPAVEYSPFQPSEDQHLMDAILSVYAGLSPENLCCDGEASQTHIRQHGAELRRKLRGLFTALGREVSEEEAYAWDRQRREYNKKRQG